MHTYIAYTAHMHESYTIYVHKRDARIYTNTPLALKVWKSMCLHMNEEHVTSDETVKVKLNTHTHPHTIDSDSTDHRTTNTGHPLRLQWPNM